MSRSVLRSWKQQKIAIRRRVSAESGTMNPNSMEKVTEVVNDIEMYQTGVFTSTEVTHVPLSLYFGEFTCLLLAVAFGLALYVRKRQPGALLLPLAALLFAVPMLPWLVSELPALQSSQWIMRVVQVLSHETWLRPVGALLLAIYAGMQWWKARKT